MSVPRPESLSADLTFIKYLRCPGIGHVDEEAETAPASPSSPRGEGCAGSPRFGDESRGPWAAPGAPPLPRAGEPRAGGPRSRRRRGCGRFGSAPRTPPDRERRVGVRGAKNTRPPTTQGPRARRGRPRLRPRGAAPAAPAATPPEVTRRLRRPGGAPSRRGLQDGRRPGDWQSGGPERGARARV